MEVAITPAAEDTAMAEAADPFKKYKAHSAERENRLWKIKREGIQ